jgi:hypothetical protein
MSVTSNASLISDKQLLESFLKNKTILDYGTILSITSDGSKADIQHQVLDIFNGKVIQKPLVTKGVEVFYLNSSSLFIDNTPQVGDPVLILGLRRFINSTKTPMPMPYAPLSPVAYERSTIKAVPLSAINNQSGLIFRAKSGKLRLRNTTVSLFKIINDQQNAIATFSNSASQSSITTGGSSSASLAGAIVALMVTLNSSMITLANEISSLLED